MIVVYLTNQIPHKILNKMTLKEAFIRNKPIMDHLQIFGCHVYIHIPKEKKKNLDHTSMKGIFAGYSASSKAYKIYKKEDRWIEVSRDAIFDESITYEKSKDILDDFDEEEIPIFEDISRDNDDQDPTSTQEYVEGSSELVQQVIVPGNRKRPTWLRTT